LLSPRIALFLPTFRSGGIDVFEASMQRQSVNPDVIYVADNKERIDEWDQVALNLGQKIHLLYPPKSLGDIRNLAKAYNEAAFNSVKSECDLFISLQDYIWIPENGIERFSYLHQKDPNALLTGITNISKDPLPEEIHDISGNYTIFKEPFYNKPKEIDWFDVRETDIYNFADAEVLRIYPEHWEANWAAVPVDMFRRRIKWDVAFDKGIAYENQDFAKQCNKETGCDVLMDRKNTAISLPHKKYWPNEESDIRKYSNRWLFEDKWAS
jgi:hypothetical protein